MTIIAESGYVFPALSDLEMEHFIREWLRTHMRSLLAASKTDDECLDAVIAEVLRHRAAKQTTTLPPLLAAPDGWDTVEA